jgi:hypothetical protein
MSLAARWISSPLPYQLGLALHELISSTYTRLTLFNPPGVMKIAGTFSRSATQHFDSRSLVTWGEMRIAQRHRNMFVAHQLFHSGQVHPCHDEPTREGMAEIMERNVRDSCSSDGCEGAVGSLVGLPRPITKDRSRKLVQCTVL